MRVLEQLIPLRQYCRTHAWPRLPQWHHWIYKKHPLASQCIKKIGGRYMVDLSALEKYINQATLDERE